MATSHPYSPLFATNPAQVWARMALLMNMSSSQHFSHNIYRDFLAAAGESLPPFPRLSITKVNRPYRCCINIYRQLTMYISHQFCCWSEGVLYLTESFGSFCQMDWAFEWKHPSFRRLLCLGTTPSFHRDSRGVMVCFQDLWHPRRWQNF